MLSFLTSSMLFTRVLWCYYPIRCIIIVMNTHKNKYEGMRKMSKPIKSLFSTKSYKTLTRIVIITYALLTIVYMFREKLYKLDNQYITLFAGTAPNLIPSFLFTLIGMFYAIPFMKGADSINKTKYILVINIVNMFVFLLIEYLHVIFKLGLWDNNDMIASLIGIILSTVVYFGIRKEFVKNINNLTIG